MKRILRIPIQTSLIVIITVLIFEVIYRFSVIDFYKLELDTLNTGIRELDLSKGVDYLIFGDSFSATRNNYVDFLRKSSDKIFINSSIPGTGIKQVNLFFSRRFKEFAPKNIIYQVYVGNDLTDVSHLTNYNELSLIRNVYWDISDVILSSSYINSRLGNFKQGEENVDPKILNEFFVSDNYNNRSKMYLRSDRSYLYKSVTITDDFEKRYSMWIKEVEEFIKSIPKNISVTILFIPHCTQLSSYYMDNIVKIGATFKDKTKFNKINYSFFKKALLDLGKYKNVSLVNPLERLRSIDSFQNRLYYLNDPHLNDKGQEIIGVYLKEKLKLN